MNTSEDVDLKLKNNNCLIIWNLYQTAYYVFEVKKMENSNKTVVTIVLQIVK